MLAETNDEYYIDVNVKVVTSIDIIAICEFNGLPQVSLYFDPLGYPWRYFYIVS